MTAGRGDPLDDRELGIGMGLRDDHIVEVQAIRVEGDILKPKAVAPDRQRPEHLGVDIGPVMVETHDNLDEFAAGW
jgi:hypothetical protein